MPTAEKDHVYKILELVGSSENSIEDAIKNAVSRAAKCRSHVPRCSLPRKPQEWKAIARVESRIRRRHSAVDEEPRDVVDQFGDRRRFATADAHDVQFDAAHRHTTGAATRQRIVERHSVEANADALCRIYDRLVRPERSAES